MSLTPQQVAEKKFTSTRFKNGYDETEVDAFLDEVEAELTRLAEEAATLRRQLDAAQLAQAVQPTAVEEEPRPIGDITPTQGEMEEMLRRTLLLAQRTADEVVAEAKAEAERHLAAVRAEAEAVRAESERQAAETHRAAATHASAAAAEFDATKRRLEQEIAALRTFESDFRGRLRAYLELQLGDLQATTLVPPGGPAVRSAVPAAAEPGPAQAVTVDAAEFAGAALSDATPDVPASVEPPSDGHDEPPGRAQEGAPAVLPELPPLPSWMSADAGFSADEEPAGAPAQTPEGA